MTAALHLLVRFVHVVGMAVLLVGPAFTWHALRTDSYPESLVRRHERVFWGAVGAMLVTGVGNAGALGAPGPATSWGRVLTVKLSLVLLLLVLSFVRTLAVVRLRTRRRTPDEGVALLRRSYAATTGLVLCLVAVAEVLAHG
jgi:putative copper export protein